MYKKLLKVLLAFVIWSFVGPIVNTTSFTASQNVFFITFPGFLGLFLIMIFSGEIKKLKKIKISLLLFIFMLFSGVQGLLFVQALTLIPIAQALFLFSSLPIIALIIEIIFFKERIKLVHIAAICMGFIGITILLSINASLSFEYFVTVGSIVMLISTFLTAIQGFIIRKFDTSVYSSNITTFLILLSQALVSIPFAMQTKWEFNTYSIVVMVFLSICSSIIAFHFYISSLKVFRVSSVRLVGYVEPFLGSIWGVVFLSQPLYPATLVGGVLILLGAYCAVKSGE